MVLDNSSPDPFSSTDSFPDSSSETPYPAPTPLAPLSGLFGYTEDDRQRYISVQTENATRLLNLDLTPHERAGLAYYDSLFYTYESYGDLLGTSTGLTIGWTLRNRKPGPITNGLARLLGQSGNARGKKLIGTAIKLVGFGVAGRMYGLTTAGLQALNRMRAEQRADPGMVRIVKARAERIGALERETRHKTMGYPPVRRAVVGGADDDEQSLGGMEMADQTRREGEATAREQSRAFPFGRPSEKVVEVEQRREESGGGDDPFGFGAEEKGSSVQKAPQRGWRNTHSNTTESTWERLRRGQAPVASSQSRSDNPDADTAATETAPRTSPWPTRAPMKGFDSRSPEPKTDSFSFSNTVEERELAKAQAQKEFDESVEKERRSGGGDGYSEGDKGGSQWRD